MSIRDVAQPGDCLSEIASKFGFGDYIDALSSRFEGIADEWDDGDLIFPA